MEKKKKLTLEDLEPQYHAFCENVSKIKQNSYWGVLFGNMGNEKSSKDRKVS